MSIGTGVSKAPAAAGVDIVADVGVADKAFAGAAPGWAGPLSGLGVVVAASGSVGEGLLGRLDAVGDDACV